jgi:glutamate synthase (ferredoxin)
VEEFGFVNCSISSIWCIMMCVCSKYVSCRTQNPELRKKFEGKPEHVVNYMYFIAQELREIMAIS